MTINQIIRELEPYNIHLLIVLVLIPSVSWGYGKVASGERWAGSPFKYVYTALVYISSVPGILAAVLTCYALFIERSSLLNINIVVYFMPIISMVATLVLIKRSVDLKHIPGIDRLYGILIVIAITFTVSLAIIKTGIWIFFGSSLLTLFVTAIVLFALLEIGIAKLFGSKSNLEKPTE